jgi:hypothetical protein
MNLTYKRPYCKSCRVIWGEPSIGRVFNCNQCGQPLTLKSFNPWLKALTGIVIVGGGLATMAIPGFPVFWIGGLLFGPMFMFNGVKQWLKIKQLDGSPKRHSPSEWLVPGGILICRKCGQMNRVSSHSRKLRPICGKCHTPLSESMLALVNRFTHRFAPACIGGCVILGLIVLAAVGNNSRPRSSAPSPSSYRPVITPQTQPSRVLSANLAEPQKDWHPELNRRLPNGTLIRGGNLDGSGKLEINNGLSLDAVAKLIDPQTDQCAAYFYISAGAVYTLSHIPDGDYRLLFATGEDWDASRVFFSRPKGVSEFSKRLSFETRKRYQGNYVYQEYSVMELTLHPVPQGTAKTHKVSMTEFQKY